MIYFIYTSHIHLFYGNIWTHYSPAPNISGFLAQLVRASHRSVWRGHGFKSVEVLNFFSAFLRNCINCGQNCEDHSPFDFISVVLIQDLNLSHNWHSYKSWICSVNEILFRGHKIVPVIKRCSRFCFLTWLMKMKKRSEIAKKPCLVLKALLKKNAALSHSFWNKKLS